MVSRKKVLIVEDSADLRRLYAIGLNQRGFEVKLAGNGAEALDRIQTEEPDVLLLDLVMPVMDGWDVLSRLHERDGNCIPVVVITGHAIDSARPTHDCIIRFLEKPVALAELGASIEEALDARERLRAGKSVEK